MENSEEKLLVDFGCLRMVPSNTGVFFAQVMTVTKRQILARIIRIQKKNEGKQTFFRDD